MVLPDLAELLERSRGVSIPLVQPFRGISHREVFIVEGPAGPAEWAPFVDYDDAEAARWLRATLESGWNPPGLSPNAAGTIAVNGTLGQIDASAVPAWIAHLGHPRCVKVKVGGMGSTLAGDIARVEAVRGVLGPAGRIRLDANGSWTLDEAEHAIREMEHFDLDYVEQPVEGLSDMAELRGRVNRLGIPIAADESIRRWSDIDEVLARGACDIAVIKVAPLGGVRPALEAIERALAAGVDVVISSALDTSIGIYHAARLHAHLSATARAVHDAGLGTVSFFTRDVVTRPLIATGGVLEIVPPALDDAAVDQLRMDPERERWWRARLERAWALL